MKPIYRLIDANSNRAREGLRVLEDIVRLFLDHKALTREMKGLREEFLAVLKKIPVPTEKLLQGRAAASDVGAALYSRSEGERADIGEIFLANAKRAEEAVRVLEEFSKIIDPKLGEGAKKLRFKLYSFEKKAFPLLKKALAGTRKRDKLDFDLYVVLDGGVIERRAMGKKAQEVIKGGVKAVQLRHKKASGSDFYALAQELRHITRKAGVTFIINDRIAVAKGVDADGVHLGKEDLPLSVAREILGSEKIIGLSATNIKEAIAAQNLGADYVGVGPIFSTPIKAGVQPTGLKLLEEVTARLNIPVVAIGGIDQANISQVVKAGTKRIAVIRAVLNEKNVASAAKQLRAAINK